MDFIQSALASFLDTHVRKVTICARSKHWWNDGIQGKRRQLG